MAASKLQSKSSTFSTKASSKTQRKQAAKNAAPKLGRAKSTAGRAVVLGQFKVANGNVYRVLAPATGPRHLTSDDVQKAVQLMVSAR